MALFDLFRQTSSKIWGEASRDDPTTHGTVTDFRNLAGTDRDLIQNGQFCQILTGVQEPGSEEVIQVARKIQSETMALVPAGETQMAQYSAVATDVGFSLALEGFQSVMVNALFCDRYTVTNQDFSKFVAAGGYRDMDLWPAEILPHLLQFVDQSGCPGPKYWSDGEFPRSKSRHPVVGISWYEAQAFAKWAGRRLPNASEWQRAGTWPSPTSGQGTELKYPWGNAFDHHRANTWVGGIRDTVAVDEFLDGCTPNGIYQLAGNVWEWVDGGFNVLSNNQGVRVLLDADMAEIRGGAFNTYFDTQVTCQFRTGQPLLHRGCNVGFRCCIGENEIETGTEFSV